MPFTADLNPKGGKSMDLLDMMKLKSYVDYDKSMKPAAKNSMVKSSPDDMGVEFKFNSNQNSKD